MATNANAPQRSTLPSTQPPPDFLAQAVQKAGKRLPNRYVIHAVEGWGKTSLGAQFPAPLFLMARQETGLETLIDSGRLGETPHLPELMSWEETLRSLEAIRTQPHEYRSLVLDAMNGFERLCHEYVCRRDFNGDWTDKGFMGYMRGYEVALSEWRTFLAALDRIREERRMAIVVLAHTKVKTFKNPEGPDYDRYAVDVHEKTWSLTHKWGDMVLFGTFYTTVEKEKGERAKGHGGQQRILLTERHASYDAKNRHGLPPDIDMGSSPTEAWNNFVAALKAGRTSNQPPTTDGAKGGEDA